MRALVMVIFSLILSGCAIVIGSRCVHVDLDLDSRNGLVTRPIEPEAPK